MCTRDDPSWTATYFPFVQKHLDEERPNGELGVKAEKSDGEMDEADLNHQPSVFIVLVDVWIVDS